MARVSGGKKTVKKANKTNSKNSKKDIKKERRIYEIELVLLISLTIIFILSLHTESVGIIGKFIKNTSFGLLGNGGYYLPYVLFTLIFLNINKNFQDFKFKISIGVILLFLSINFLYAISDFNIIRDAYISESMKLISVSSFQNFYLSGKELMGGGVINNILTMFLYLSVGKYGLLIVTITMMIISLILLTNFKLKSLKTAIKIKKTSVSEPAKRTIKIKENIQENAEEIKVPIIPEVIEKKPEQKKIKIFNYSDFNEEPNEKLDPSSDKEIVTELNKNINSKILNYVKPRVTLLTKPKHVSDQIDKSAIIEKAEILERTLLNFGIDAKVVEINKGPTITRYEIQPKPGTKISKIVNLSDDLALNLAVSQVRVAPVPGKVAVGIEVPNEENSMVKIREILESEEFRKSNSKLSMALGKNISGEAVISDLASMPHLLIAGATGSGKSVCVNTIITSILYNADPDEVKMLMIDPKVVELNIYNGIPHLILPVVTDPKKASIALGWAVNEMTKRYEIFADNQVKDIDGYNLKNEETRLPKIVVIIDELADLMMVAPNQVEDSIARLAQMARAAGIHLIVATQRPSVDVITGLIKANITSRIAFSVSSQIDSRTILDMAGAEKLLGKGDMLFNPVGASKPIRLQGAFISENEIEKIVEHIKSQVIEVAYNNDILNETEKLNVEMNSDELTPEIIRFLSNQKTISVSMLQRKYRIGYNRAARIIDELESQGIVSASQGSKPREVLLTIEQLDQYQ
ncbi:MAG: DUF87 domain-containing protein [Clostridiales bacterium]|nr:DUF87 domain-containing protein [Clostridiales bacterium]